MVTKMTASDVTECQRCGATHDPGHGCTPYALRVRRMAKDLEESQALVRRYQKRLHHDRIAELETERVDLERRLKEECLPEIDRLHRSNAALVAKLRERDDRIAELEAKLTAACLDLGGLKSHLSELYTFVAVAIKKEAA